ncbi:reprolysin-like metallopeptidase [Hymenobacter antarcticus]|uniref:Peptidase M12B domain-containing protein n=1 Tax=Hymenobacter antarcticus TaxID=486270 RepID=A0ABP7QXA1_9BACT
MMKRYSVASLLLALALAPAARAQTPTALWQPAPAPQARGDARPEAGRWFSLDAAQLAARLAPAPPETRPREAVVLELPYPDGRLHRFAITHVPVLAPALAARYPEIQTYAGRGLDEPTATVRLETAPAGLHAQVLGAGGEVVALAPDPAAPGRYHSQPGTPPAFSCQALPVPGFAARPQSGVGAAPPAPYGSQLRTLRLAMAATGEYTQSLGGGTVSGALASMATLVNTLNAVYERDLALRLQLVANNNLLVYTDPATDPYDNANLTTMLNGNQAIVDGAITSAAYDVGHVLGYRGGGYSGVAYVGVICNGTYKARGTSTGASASLMATVLMHEIGHQLGSGHTFNGDQGNCGSSNRGANTAYEPGAGNTIMSYDSRCAPDNVGSAVNFFHAGSLTNIIPELACAGTTASGNQPPSLTVPPSNTYTIPLSTPFTLSGSGSDPNGDALTYSWEQLDLGNASGLAGAPTDVSAPPLFRSFAPVASPTRTFPSLPNILSGTASTSEQLPRVARPLNFRLTARDNRGGVAGANVTLAVAAAGPFAVTAPGAAFTAAPGSTYALTWSVLGTDQAPVSCANVQVLFSSDGGLTFPTELLASTPNDGSANVRLPGTATTLGRLKIQALGNVFFAINNANITLAGTPLPVELVAFSAEARGPVAHLAWTTASEKNNAGFEVEGSPDGRAFRRLGWVAGQGSSSAARAYQFDDGTLATAAGPQMYYRLRQLDTDGTATFSPVRTVAVPTSRPALLQLWPNPAHGTVAVGGMAPGEAVQLLDLAGRVLLSAVLPAEGPLQLPLPAGLAPGVYVVRSGSQTRRLAVE